MLCKSDDSITQKFLEYLEIYLLLYSPQNLTNPLGHAMLRASRCPSHPPIVNIGISGIMPAYRVRDLTLKLNNDEFGLPYLSPDECRENPYINYLDRCMFFCPSQEDTGAILLMPRAETRYHAGLVVNVAFIDLLFSSLGLFNEKGRLDWRLITR